MRVEVLSAEIGSTTTVVSAFDGLTRGEPRFLGQGSAPTTVEAGDVRLGLEAAVESLKAGQGWKSLKWERFSASSSAAGGLRMSVHGLVYDMTVKAAREAALGAGANICNITAGKMRPRDAEKLIAARPNIVLIAGGVDYGERDTALHNGELIAEALASAGLRIPAIYAGNIENREEIVDIFSRRGLSAAVVDNVYPRIDELVIEPTRGIIQRLFEEHIVTAPGMEHIRELVNGHIMPVPGAVMRAAELLRKELMDLIVFDIGGATSDLHSVCSDTPEVSRMLIAPEPEAKRTVEGDLGLYVNRRQVMQQAERELTRALECEPDELRAGLEALPPMPASEEEQALARELAFHAGRLALERHAGRYRELYSLAGKQRYAEGKDLTGVGTVIGTGGALTRLPGGEEILRRILSSGTGRELYPPPESRILLDRDYIMAALGVLADDYPAGAAVLLRRSLEEKDEVN